jgi:hypothetical protein
MATFNPKRLTNPEIIRSIEPARLLKFLHPYRDYLRDRGLSLPSARQATGLDLDRLVDILLTPGEKTPQDLLNAVYLIDELSTPQGMDALLAAARRAGMPFDEKQDHSPADIAVQVWLFSPAIVEDQHAWQAWRTPRKMKCFQSTSASDEPPIQITLERIGRAENDCGDWFSHNNRGRSVKLFRRNVGHEIHFSLRRGDPFRRELAITADGVENVHFRPAKHDTIIFDLVDRELRINTPIKQAYAVYCRVFGALLFDDPEHFHDVSIHTLAPLAELGEDALSPGEDNRIEKIALTQIRVDLGGPYNAYAIFGADDYFADLKHRNQEFFMEHKLVDATFRIKYSGVRVPRMMKFYAGNAAAYTRDENADAAEQWLLLRRFIARAEARGEKGQDDKALAGV